MQPKKIKFKNKYFYEKLYKILYKISISKRTSSFNWIERSTSDREVLGSTPSWSTNKLRKIFKLFIIIYKATYF